MWAPFGAFLVSSLIASPLGLTAVPHATTLGEQSLKANTYIRLVRMEQNIRLVVWSAGSWVLGGSRVSKADAVRPGDAGSRNAFGAIHRVDFRQRVRVAVKQLGRFVPRNRSASSQTVVEAGATAYETTDAFPAAASAAAGQHP